MVDVLHLAEGIVSLGLAVPGVQALTQFVEAIELELVVAEVAHDVFLKTEELITKKLILAVKVLFFKVAKLLRECRVKLTVNGFDDVIAGYMLFIENGLR